jgi:hypothetical protein
MVLARVNLLQNAAYAWPTLPKHDEQVFDQEFHLRQLVDDFDMGEPLFVGAHFVLALDNVNPTWL